jgi:MoaA/NifB/PqqE/SkfB family radical SAM enzyme
MIKSDKRFYDWNYILNSAKYFKGIKRINLTGGEPSIHPEFEKWIPSFKNVFECEVLSVWTNGTMFRKKPSVWQYFDEIHITNYTKETFDGSPDNSEEIEFIRALYPNKKIYSTKTVHDPLTKRGNKMCFRGYSDTIEFVDGYVYPCSSSSGLPTKVRYKLDENWLSEVLKLTPPCYECLFAEI